MRKRRLRGRDIHFNNIVFERRRAWTPQRALPVFRPFRVANERLRNALFSEGPPPPPPPPPHGRANRRRNTRNHITLGTGRARSRRSECVRRRRSVREGGGGGGECNLSQRIGGGGCGGAGQPFRGSKRRSDAYTWAPATDVPATSGRPPPSNTDLDNATESAERVRT